MNEAIALVAAPEFWAGVITAVAPLLLGVFGALICGRAGILPLSAEGVLTAAAVAAVLATRSGAGADPWIALAVALAVGLLIGLVHAVLVAPLALPQQPIGLAIMLLTIAGAHALLGADATTEAAAGNVEFAAVDLPWLAHLPYAGAALRAILRQPPTVYLAALAIAALGYVLAMTPLGLLLRICGESPAAVAAQGRSVAAMRILAAMIGSALMALAGASLALTGGIEIAAGTLDGRGFLWLLLAAAAGWRMMRAVVLAGLFGLLQAALADVPEALAGPVAAAWLPLLPYVLALAAFIAMSRDAMRRFAPRR